MVMIVFRENDRKFIDYRGFYRNNKSKQGFDTLSHDLAPSCCQVCAHKYDLSQLGVMPMLRELLFVFCMTEVTVAEGRSSGIFSQNRVSDSDTPASTVTLTNCPLLEQVSLR